MSAELHPTPRALRPATLRALVELALARIAPASPHELATGSLAQYITAVRAAPEGAGVANSPDESAWLALAARLALDDAELLAGWVTLTAECDPVFAARLRALQGDGRIEGNSRPTLGLLARMLAALDGRGAHAHAAIQAALLVGAGLASGLFRLRHDELPASERALELHAALVPVLLGAVPRDGDRVAFEGFEAELAAPPRWEIPATWAGALVPLDAALATGESALTVLRANDLAESRGAGVLAAARAGWRVALLRAAGREAGARTNAAPPRGLEPWLLALQAVPLVEVPRGPEARVELPVGRHYRGPVIAAAGRDGEIEPREFLVREITLATPAPAGRAALWRAALAHLPDADATRLAAWRSGVAALHAVADAARGRAAARGDAPAFDDVLAARDVHVRSEVRRLGALAQPADAPIDDAAFVVGAEERAALGLFEMHCRERETLLDTLGAVIRARATPGLKALFVGASGTGKTLAAQWLAHRLGRPLLRVDAAAVTSKYIGETEKNLAQLLAHAEHLDCVLLFDEADALFGARTDVKQSNDRFANAQTNYLLTRIETFDGIAVLTSNSKARFDDAFIRRLDAIVEFRLPGPEQRLGLWRAHLGDAHALTPADLGLLAAQFDLPGGNIRNVALGAMLVARARGRARIERADLATAIDHEYRKLGRAIPGALPAG